MGCTCESGYIGTGEIGDCEDLDACSTDPCDSNATCIDHAPPSTGRTCTCENGFSGTGEVGDCVFTLSEIADNSQIDQINSWMPANGSKNWTLCYSKNIHGGNASTFHSNCDDRGHSVVLIRLSTGKKIGGYAHNGWISSNNWIGESNCFLFSLTNNFKHDSRNGVDNLYDGSNYGPTFGGGHDLYINDSLNGGYCNPGHTYECRVGSGSDCRNDFCGNYDDWTVQSLEVFIIN